MAGELQEVLSLIKDSSWIGFTITKEDLLRPTQELAVRFYKSFLDDCNEKMTCLTGVSVPPSLSAAEYEPEEQMFRELSRMLESIFDSKFTLADIYQPTRIRTLNFFRVCIHFATFTEYLQGDMDMLGADIFKIKQETGNLSDELQNLIDETNENAKEKAGITENKNLLDEEYRTTKSAYKEMKAMKTTKEKVNSEKKSQIENLKRELENEEYELKRLENIEKGLVEQRTTEREYQTYVTTLDSLKRESELLDSNDIDIADCLEHENKILQHSTDCINMLQKCVFNVEKVKTHVHKEKELKALKNTIHNLVSTKLNPMKQRKSENVQKLMLLREKLLNVQTQSKTMKDTYACIISRFSQEISTLKDSLENKSKHNCRKILENKEHIKKLEADLDKLKATFTAEYVKVSKAEKVVVDKFKDILIKFKVMD